MILNHIALAPMNVEKLASTETMSWPVLRSAMGLCHGCQTHKPQRQDKKSWRGSLERGCIILLSNISSLNGLMDNSISWVLIALLSG